MDIFKILNNDLSGMTDEERVYAEKFTDNLKEKLIDELVIYESEDLIKKLNRDKEEFINSIEHLLVNGTLGYSKMPIQVLINIFLDKIGESDFINIIEEIG